VTATTDSAHIVEIAIGNAIVDIVRGRDIPLLEVRPELHLVHDLGFDSLDLARLVAELEIALGVDPFQYVSATAVQTVGDVCVAYRRHLSAPAPVSRRDRESTVEAMRGCGTAQR
jgi:acyl carrier protein